ncbi:uncharacterized protein TOT_010000478 [Theileria orientalis strain Shintoku]|uniref:CWF21 domain-containing protein n=1 Tax=Theileria orientalis strain Shintoku TaxID=869250 RepID=J4C7G8_THEOR|nr:uncharacterized protein TOT_010000478 [Theileria orientalis strain Shintoku]PVC50107.1 hypothetical protein MACL_00002527 [Theileria orientalis]BAM39013.1 uncharacterized protein TOT_010000478 [Theileria orientalis strain Shintoku]|eukprot:XP_009689314.1 uncharacterized protein TOT_010000478 [Theileria orientalis strain Shintoku]
MFNGVGLRTPRGSGTNGYVQRSLATLPSKKVVKLSNQSDAISRPKSRTDPAILLHEKKREIELKLLQLRTTLKGSMTDQEIETEIQKQREFMLQNLNSVSLDVTKNEHIMAQLKRDQMDNLQQVLKIKNSSNSGGAKVDKTSGTSTEKGALGLGKNATLRPMPARSRSYSGSSDVSGYSSGRDETSSFDSDASSISSRSSSYVRRDRRGSPRLRSYRVETVSSRTVSSHSDLSSVYSRDSDYDRTDGSYSSDSYESSRRGRSGRKGRYRSPSLSSYSSSRSSSRSNRNRKRNR